MKDPHRNMDHQNLSLKRQTPTAQVERRNPNKLVRVAFDPDVDSHDPPRDKSPAPPAGHSHAHHHRSFTAIDQKLLPLPQSAAATSSGRPTSSSAGDGPAAVASEERPRLTSDRASDSGARPTAALKRARSDYGPRIDVDRSVFGDDDEDIAMRHGWQEEYTSSEYLKVLHSVCRNLAL